MSETAKRSLARAALALLIVLHLYTSVSTFFENWYYTYTGRSWVLLGLWLLGLLALDVRLYFQGGAEMLRSLKWYWGFSAALITGMFLWTLLDLPSPPAWAALAVVLSLFLTPLHQLTAFLWLLFQKMAGVEGRMLLCAQYTAMLLVCLAHFIYLVWLHRRARKKGAPPHGPLDPGTGTVE